MNAGEVFAASSPAAVSFRDRVLLFYEHYCPEKATRNHVDSVLAKYTGYESDVLDVLRAKYGPEPVTTPPRQSTAVQTETSSSATAPITYTSHSDVARSAAVLEAELAKRRNLFEVDRVSIAATKQHNVETSHTEGDFDVELQHQARTIRQLRTELSVALAKKDKLMAHQDQEIRRKAKLLAQSKIELLDLRESLESSERRLSTLYNRITLDADSKAAYLRNLVEAIRTYLRLNPRSPLRDSILGLDSGLRARHGLYSGPQSVVAVHYVVV